MTSESLRRACAESAASIATISSERITPPGAASSNLRTSSRSIDVTGYASSAVGAAVAAAVGAAAGEAVASACLSRTSGAPPSLPGAPTSSAAPSTAITRAHRSSSERCGP
eukprot:1422024-Prymnesium_polylepis.1